MSRALETMPHRQSPSAKAGTVCGFNHALAQSKTVSFVSLLTSSMVLYWQYKLCEHWLIIKKCKQPNSQSSANQSRLIKKKKRGTMSCLKRDCCLRQGDKVSTDEIYTRLSYIHTI